MNTVSRRGYSVLKGVLVVACLAMGIFWPEWRVSLQQQGYENLPPLCGQTCNFLSNCSQPCDSECTFDTNSRTWDCERSTCGESAICKLSLPDLCNELCGEASNCGKSCIDENGFTQICTACPDPDPEPEPPPPDPDPEPPPPDPDPEPPPPDPDPEPPPPPDEVLSSTYGVSLDASRYGLYGADSLFQDPRGTELRQTVLATAAEFGISPGLLAVNVAAEVRGGDAVAIFTGRDPVQSKEVGLDYWGTYLRRVVMRNVPEARDIISKELPENFINEKNINTGPVHEFPNGPTALRALAATLRYSEIRLSRDGKVGTEAWNNLPIGTRFAIVRAYYNAGGLGVRMARDAANGQNVLVTSGVPGPDNPARASTIRAAQAIHMSRDIFQDPVQ